MAYGDGEAKKEQSSLSALIKKLGSGVYENLAPSQCTVFLRCCRFSTVLLLVFASLLRTTYTAS